MSFASRLSEAAAEAKADYKILSPNRDREDSKRSQSTRATDANARALETAEQETSGAVATHAGATSKANTREKEDDLCAAQPKKSPKIVLELVSEYLFDLFDANCMDEYRKIEAFHNKALASFDPDVDEYSFEQERLHNEFCALFEGFCEGYIREQGYSMEEFYEVVREAKLESDAKTENREGSARSSSPPPWDQDPDHAIEVVETIYSCSDFRTWVEYMKGLARQRQQYLVRYS